MVPRLSGISVATAGFRYEVELILLPEVHSYLEVVVL